MDIQKNVLHAVLFKSSSRIYETPLLVPMQCFVRRLQAGMLPEIIPLPSPRSVTIPLNLLTGPPPTNCTHTTWIGEGDQIEKHQ